MPIMSDPQHSDCKGPKGGWKAGWICPRCHEAVTEWFEICWNCAETKPSPLASSTDRIVEIDGLLFSDFGEFSAHFEERTGLAPCTAASTGSTISCAPSRDLVRLQAAS